MRLAFTCFLGVELAGCGGLLGKFLLVCNGTFFSSVNDLVFVEDEKISGGDLNLGEFDFCILELDDVLRVVAVKKGDLCTGALDSGCADITLGDVLLVGAD